MKMASKRFVKFTEEQIASFTEDQENANTKKKTASDLKLFNEFLNSEEEERNIENIRKYITVHPNHTVSLSAFSFQLLCTKEAINLLK